jgi:peptide-methionine (S)-S-oxide reductase
MSDNSNTTMASAVLAGGCFWCVEAVYERTDGVKFAVSGYTGGTVVNPSYKRVTTGATGHAEAVKITFDPGVISYKEILEIFWKSHDPTTLNKQGGDIGTQYRSAIYYSGEDQKKIAEESLEEARSLFVDKIMTEIAPLSEFYVAEEYHQDYFELNPNAGYCQYVIAPKLKKLGLGG